MKYVAWNGQLTAINIIIGNITFVHVRVSHIRTNAITDLLITMQFFVEWNFELSFLIYGLSSSKRAFRLLFGEVSGNGTIWDLMVAENEDYAGEKGIKSEKAEALSNREIKVRWIATEIVREREGEMEQTT